MTTEPNPAQDQPAAGQSEEQTRHRAAPPLPPREAQRRAAHARKGRRTRRVPFVRLFGYYLLLVGIIAVLAWFLPIARHAYLSPIDVPVTSKTALFGGEAPAAASLPAEPDLQHTLIRTATTLFVVLGALSLVLPCAWVYMFTKRLRYDASLVQSVIILPVVVSGILMIVKNSLALAFSLAGIVAAVRFRNTLKDPKDAVYIFLALGIGLASGVQAVDIALVLSLAFNVIVLVLWKFNVGALYSRGYGPRGILSIGDRRLLVAQTPQARRGVRERLVEEAEGMKTDGILLVHAADPEAARHAVEVSLSQAAKDWKLADTVPGPAGLHTLEFLMRMKKKSTVVELLGELDDRWSSQVSAAEFLPFTTKKNQSELAE